MDNGLDEDRLQQNSDLEEDGSMPTSPHIRLPRPHSHSQRECDEISNNVFLPNVGRHRIHVIGESQPVYVRHTGPYYEPMDESTDNDIPRVPRYSQTSSPTGNNPFNIEQRRYESFQGKWNSPFVTPDALAKAGFRFLGPPDRVKCVFCNGVLANWEAGDNPQTEHRKHFPNCPFILGQNVNNVSSFRHIASIQHNIPARITTTLVSPQLSQEIKHPQYRIKAERLVTFNDWPSQMRQKPEDLAEAGLFYLGHGDKVKCYVCDGMLHSWDSDDEPWIEHAKWFPDCDYVKMVKGEEFIKGVANGTIKTLHPMQEVADASSSRNTGTGSQRIETSKRMVGTGPERVEKPVPMEGTGTKTMKSIFEGRESMSLELNDDEYTSLVEENRNLKDQKLCKICLENDISVIFLPCGHVCCCGECSMSVNACPICRNVIERRSKAFLP